jgi:hypothetical protein
VPRRHDAEKAADPRAAAAEQLAGVGADQLAPLRAERDLDRRIRAGAHGDRGRHVAGSRRGALEDGLDGKGSSAGGRRAGLGCPPIGPGGHLLLVGQEDPGDRHDHDHRGHRRSDGEVHPEQDLSKRLHVSVTRG